MAITILLQNLVWFIARLLFIEGTVEVIRMAIFTLWNNVWPTNPYDMDKWNYASWVINCLETAIVATMLYLGYDVLTIIGTTFVIIFIVTQITRYVCKNGSDV